MPPSSSNTRSIYFENRVYEGVKMVSPNNYRETFNLDALTIVQEYKEKYIRNLNKLTNYEVTGAHSWVNFQDVTGLYELQSQVRSYGGSDWEKCTEHHYRLFAEPPQLARIIALPKQPTGSTEDGLYGECAKHPGQNMVNCIHCKPSIKLSTEGVEEKARELTREFYLCMPFKDSKLGSCDEKPELIVKMEMLAAKQCALICVDEILNDREDALDVMKDARSINLVKVSMQYWQSVRKSIEQI